MKEAFVSKDGITIRDSPIPTPEADQVLIRVIVSGTNPKDWKYPEWQPENPPFNQGDDVAGYVEDVGSSVQKFRKGDRVAALHRMLTPHGSYAEYAIAWESTTFHLPPNTEFEEAATLPLAAMTAGLGLYQSLSLPLPWNPTSQSSPLVIYGGATAVGAFAIKLATLSNIHPIIAVAGRATSFVETLIDRSKGDTIIDYRDGDEVIRKKIAEACQGHPLHNVFDTVSEKGSAMNCAAVMAKPGKIIGVLPIEENDRIPDQISFAHVNVATAHEPPSKGKKLEDQAFANVFFAFIGQGLAQGWFRGHPFELREGGLEGLELALKDLKSGKASAVKYVVRVAQDQGV